MATDIGAEAGNKERAAPETRQERVLIVCSGNTCRSPMAEALTRKLRAGLETIGGSAATKEAIATMREMGLDLGQHRSQGISGLDLASFDRVIAMTPGIARRLTQLGVSPECVVALNIRDPHGREIAVYRSTAAAIERELRVLFGMAINQKDAC